MQRSRANYFEQTSDFISSINRFSMKFKNKEYEKAFIKAKFESKNLLVVIGLTVLFNILMIGIRL